MPLDSLYPNGILLLPEDVADEVPVLLDSVPSMPETGWDSLRQRYLLHDTVRADARAAAAHHFSRGQQLDGLNMWIVDFGARTLASALYEIEVTSKGLLDARGYKASGTAAAAVQSAENILDPGGTLRPKVSTMEAEPTLVLEYLLIGTAVTDSLFPTAKAGLAQAPPAGWDPAVAPSPWAWIADPVWHYPNGWCLVASDFDLLPGVQTAALIKDRYQYIRQFTP